MADFEKVSLRGSTHSAVFRQWQGSRMIDPRPHRTKARSLHNDSRQPLKLRVRAVGACRGGLPSLTPREREVIVRLAQGGTNRQIAMALKVSPRTVEKHVERILAKLGATNRTVAALLAARAGNLISRPT
jgi:DNA-binding NarL/FixJ family response regulator